MKKSNKEKLEKLNVELKKIKKEISNLEIEERKKRQKINQKLIGKYFRRNEVFCKILKIDDEGYLSAIDVEFYTGEDNDKLELEFDIRRFESLEYINHIKYEETTKKDFEKGVIKRVMTKLKEKFGD